MLPRLDGGDVSVGATAARLSVRRVDFSYGGAKDPALRGVCLELAPRRCLGLIGPNGAGKTTLLKLAVGLVRPGAGEVLVDGADVRRLGPRELGRLVAYVPQSFSLPFTFTVLEVVLQGRHPYLTGVAFESRHDLEVAQDAMEQTGVWALRGRTFDALSGGERQRVLIAAALAQEPKLLVLDEPTSSLDLRFQSALVRLVRDLLERRDLSVLVAFHDLNLASTLCDELVLLVDGEVQAAGAPAAVLDRDVLERAYRTALHVGRGPQGIFVLPLVPAVGAEEG
jgi:iron complex transport system ATP-binding protein